MASARMNGPRILLEGFLEALRAEEHRLFQRRDDDVAEMRVAVAVFERFLENDFDDKCDEEAQARWEARQERGLRDADDVPAEMDYAMAEARKIK